MKAVGVKVWVVLATTRLVRQTAGSGQRGTLQHPAAGTRALCSSGVTTACVTAACHCCLSPLPVSPPPVTAACATAERQRSEAPVPTWAAMTPAELRAAPWAP